MSLQAQARTRKPNRYKNTLYQVKNRVYRPSCSRICVCATVTIPSAAWVSLIGPYHLMSFIWFISCRSLSSPERSLWPVSTIQAQFAYPFFCIQSPPLCQPAVTSHQDNVASIRTCRLHWPTVWHYWVANTLVHCLARCFIAQPSMINETALSHSGHSGTTSIKLPSPHTVRIERFASARRKLGSVDLPSANSR